jgi:putative aldouronate transport system substrate-binding protein
VENNRLADLTEPYTQSIGGYAADMIRPLNGAHLTQVTRNGRIYAIPQIPTGYNYNLLWVRKDWLDKVNMPVPRTLEEMKNTALAFQRAQLGGPNTIGIVTDSVTVLGQSHSFLSLSTIANAVNAYPKSWIRDKSGNVIWGSVAPEMKDALAVLADWYRAGILDPQFMTYQNMDAVTPAIREGRTGMYFGAYWSPWTVADTMVQDTAMEWVYVLGPVDANGKFNHVNPLDPDSLVVVASTARNPEAVVKAANVLHQLENGAYFNEPGILDRYNATIGIAGARTLTPIPGNLANEFDRELKKGIAIAGYINTGRLDMWPTATTNDREDAEKAYAWYENPSRTNTDGYSLYNSFMTMNDIANADFNYDQPIAYAFTTMSMADYWPALLSLENEMIIQIISGQRPLSYFDDFVREWKAGGGDIITNEVRAITK